MDGGVARRNNHVLMRHAVCLVWLGTRFVSCQVKLWTFFDPFRCVFRFSLWGSRGHGVFFQSWDHANVKRSGCCFGFRGNYSGILPAKFRILHKFAALAGSFFDKFVRFSLFTDPSWGQIVSSHPTISCFIVFFPRSPSACLALVCGGWHHRLQSGEDCWARSSRGSRGNLELTRAVELRGACKRGEVAGQGVRAVGVIFGIDKR